MSLSNKPLEAICEDDLQALIENQVAEGKMIEYKESLPGASTNDKKEFLADVSSFANASGGHLVFGMKEAGGLPKELCGLQLTDVDDAILRLENLMRDGLEPRILGAAPKPVP